MDTLKGKLLLSGTMTTLSGLCIGHDRTGSNNASIARMVVRHPISLVPFIPGSTFKGAIRRLLEKEAFYGKEESENASIREIFGISGKQCASTTGSRPKGKATFRDAYLTEESLQNLLAKSHDSHITEVKVYTGMDRITSQGNSYAIEEIPVGSCFAFEILFTVYQQDDLAHFSRFLTGLGVLETSFLGSHGSRGLGKIRFGKCSFDDAGCISNLSAGISLVWRPSEYYEKGTGEMEIFKSDEKAGIPEIIAQFERVKAAVK